MAGRRGGGSRYNESLTYARYPDAIEAFPKKKDTEISEAIQKGEIVFIDNFGTVKVCTDINTLTSFSVDKGQEYSKNRVMRVLTSSVTTYTGSFPCIISEKWIITRPPGTVKGLDCGISQ